MRRAWFAAALAALAAGAALAQTASGPAGGSASARAAPDAERGRRIVENGTSSGAVPCAQCHGVDGSGVGSDAFPRIDGQPAFYIFKQLNDYASGARDNPIMGPIAQSLSETERQDLAAYFGSLPFVASPPPTSDPQLSRTGRVIATMGIPERGVQGCVNCHGPDGAGIAPATPRLAGQWASYTRAQLDAFRQGTRNNDVAAVMRDLSRRMNEGDMAAASAYFEAQRPGRAP